MRPAFAALTVLAALLAGAAPAHAQRVERPSPGAWPDRVYRWSYNPADRPAWLSAQEARQLLVSAAREWETCGIRMEYEGETTTHSAGVMDGMNVVGWAPVMPRNLRGITQGRAKHGNLIERDITFASARAEFRRFPTLLRKVIVHEFGHAIGLTHSAACNDVMTLAADCPGANPMNLPQTPTPHDVERCRALYLEKRQ